MFWAAWRLLCFTDQRAAAEVDPGRKYCPTYLAKSAVTKKDLEFEALGFLSFQAVSCFMIFSRSL